ncbi:hypothetical protein D3C75_1193090 [compost metagenome]
MNGLRRNLRLGQAPHQPVSAVLSPGEHQGAGDGLVLQQIDEQRQLIRLVHVIEHLLDSLHRCGGRGNLNFDRILQ